MQLNLDLKNRKRINNGFFRDLPKFDAGTQTALSVPDINNRFNNLGVSNNQFQGGTLTQSPQTFFGTSELSKPTVKNPNTSYGNTGSTWQQNTTSGADSAASGIHWGFALGSWLGGGVLEGLQSIKDKDTLMAESAKHTDSVNGIEYEQYNIDNGDELMHDYNRSTKLDFLTNPARGLTKLFGRSKQESEIKEARAQKMMLNMFNKAEAQSNVINRDYYKNHGWVNNQQMHAFNGKDVYTSSGMIQMPQNAWVSKGEYVWNGIDTPEKVTSGKNDTAPAYLDGRDTVFTNNPEIPAPFGFKTIAKAVPYATATGQLPQLAQWQANVKQDMKIDKTGKIKAANGYVPAWPNYVSSAIGAAASLGQILDASSQKVHNTDVYAPDDSDYWMNEYNKLDIPWYPVQSNLLRNRAMNTRMIDYSNLAGPVKTLAKMNNIDSYYTNLSNAWNDFVSKRIGLKSDMFKTGISATQNKAARQQAANISNRDYYAQGQAAKTQMGQMGLRNAMDYMQNWASSEMKRRQANYMLGLYRDDLTEGQKRFLMDYANSIAKAQSENKNPVIKTPMYVLKEPKLEIPSTDPYDMWITGTNKNWWR